MVDSADDKPWMDAARDALWTYDQYRSAKTPLDAAGALVELNNHMHDLATWLPEFDSNRGWLVGEGDDA